MNTVIRKLLNDNLDKLVRPEIPVLHKSWPVFQICGYVGLALGILLTMTLATHLELSLWVMAELVLTAVLTFLALAMVTKIITGEENLIYYHHEIAVMVVAAWLLKLLHQPVLAYLDLIILGMGTFLVFGRVGCLMVGCCHGRPHGWGVCYTREHKEAGFTPYLVNVRLFPIQLLESLIVLFVVIVGTGMVLRTSYRPGEALTWYVIFYGATRFYFEFLRGDLDRPYIAGFSEAQWTSIVLMTLTMWAEWNGTLPFHFWHGGVTAIVALAMIVVSLRQSHQSSMSSRILHPYHIKEVAEAIEGVSAGNPPTTCIPVCCTSIGVRISQGRIEQEDNRVSHYSLSCSNCCMSEKTAKTLAVLILKLRHPLDSAKIVRGRKGVFHVLISPQ